MKQQCDEAHIIGRPYPLVSRSFMYEQGFPRQEVSSSQGRRAPIIRGRWRIIRGQQVPAATGAMTDKATAYSSWNS